MSSHPTTTAGAAESTRPPNPSSPTPSRPSWIAICLFLLAGLTLWPRLADLAGQATPQANAAATASAALPTKAIQEIKPDDWVLARAEHGSQVTWKPVKEVYRRRADHLRIVTFRDARGQLQTLQTTDDHPFWSEQEREFLPAEELAVGDAVTGADGSSLILVSTRREDYPQGIDVYNFQVADFHTYFVAESDRSTPILVHNADYSPPNIAGLLPQPKTYADHHIFPQKFRAYFRSLGIDVDDYTITLEHFVTHARGVHGKGNNGQFPGRWNRRWEEFISNSPNATAKDAFQFAGRLLDDFGLSHLPIHKYLR